MQVSLKKHHQYQKSTPKKRLKDDLDLDPTIYARVMTEPDDLEDELVPLYSDDNDNFQSFVQVNEIDVNELESSKDDIFKSLSLSFYNTRPEDMIICNRPPFLRPNQDSHKNASTCNEHKEPTKGQAKAPSASTENTFERKSALIPTLKSKANAVNPIEKAKALMNRIAGAAALSRGQAEIFYQDIKKQKENTCTGKLSSTAQHYQISLKKNDSKLGVTDGSIKGGEAATPLNSSKELSSNVSTAHNSSSIPINSKKGSSKAEVIKKVMPIFERKFTVENIQRPATASGTVPKHAKIISPNKKSMVAAASKKLKEGPKQSARALVKEEFGMMKKESNYVKDIKLMLDRSIESRSVESGGTAMNLGKGSSNVSHASGKDPAREKGKPSIKKSRHLQSRDSNFLLNDTSRESSVEKIGNVLHDSLEKKPGTKLNWDNGAKTSKAAGSKYGPQNSFKNILNRFQGSYAQNNGNMPVTKMRNDKKSNPREGKENKLADKGTKPSTVSSKRNDIKLSIKRIMDISKNDNSDFILLSNRSKGSPLRGTVA